MFFPICMLLFSLSLCLYLLLAPSSAENLTVAYNSTNIIITWSTPVYPNGLVNFTVVVKERDLLDDSGDPPTIIEQQITKELELVVDYVVNAYHEYVVSVTSQTSAGMGESVMETFVTPEDGKKTIRTENAR